MKLKFLLTAPLVLVSTDSTPCLNQGEQLLYILQDSSEYVCLCTHTTVTLGASFCNLLFKKPTQ